mgnify:CR=1 FL=1
MFNNKNITITTTLKDCHILDNPLCPPAPICDDFYLSECVIYNGPDIPCLNIFDGMSVNDILQDLLGQLTQYCTTSTTSTSTTSTTTTSTSTTTTTSTSTTTTTTINCTVSDGTITPLEKFTMFATSISDIYFRNGLYSSVPFYVDWGDDTIDYFPTGCPFTNVHTYITNYTGPISIYSKDLSGILNFYDVTYTGPSVTITTAELGKLDQLKQTDFVQLIVTGDVIELPRTLKTFVCWGKGQSSPITGDVKDLPRYLTWTNIIGQNTLYGVIADFPRSAATGTYLFNVLGNNTIVGNIANLPTTGFTSCSVSIWGANKITGNVSDIPSNYKTVDIRGGATPTYGNTITGDIANVPANIETLILGGNTTIFGNIEDLPSTIKSIYFWGKNTVGGNLHNLVAPNLKSVTLYNGVNGLEPGCTVEWNLSGAATSFPLLNSASLASSTYTHGSLSNLPGNISDLSTLSLLYKFRVNGTLCNITGDLADLPPQIKFFAIIESGGSINTYTSPHSFISGIYNISINTPSYFSGIQASNLLNDLTTPWDTNGTIYLKVAGGLAALTPTGLAAKLNLESQGATVTII